MAQDVWLNLPVKDLPRSIAFFAEIGFSRLPGPGNGPHSASFTIGHKKIVLMLFDEKIFPSFTHHPVADTGAGTEVLFSLGADDRGQVDDLASKVEKAGGKVYAQPGPSNEFMYGCGFCDPDGHRWNVLFMEMGKNAGR